MADLAERVVTLYYAYLSFKAIESRPKDDDTQWLTYWCIYGCLHAAEVADGLVNWLPFYSVGKLALLVYLGQFRGALKVYEVFARPMLLKYQDRIDEGLEDLRSQSMTSLASAARQGVADVEAGLSRAVQAGVKQAVHDSIEGEKQKLAQQQQQ